MGRTLPMRSWGRLWLACLLALLSAGCGPGRQQDPQELRFPGPAAEAYADDPGQPGRWTRVTLERLGRAVSKPPAPDACLERAAGLLAAHLGERCEYWPQWVEEAALQHAGCPELGADSIIACTSGWGPGAFLDSVAREFQQRRADRFGVGRASQGWLRSAWVLLGVERGVRLERVARRVEPGSLAKLAFEIAGGFRSPRVFSMRTGGAIESLPVFNDPAPGPANVLPNGRFFSYFQPAEKGLYWIEVMADGADGPKVLALFQVNAGVPVPDRVVRPAVQNIKASSADEAESALLVLLTQERGRRGLPPVAPDPALAQVARRWSGELRGMNKLAHLSPDGRGPAERAQEAGYAARALGEVLASGETVWDAHQALMASPAHRAAMLDLRYTHAGIGASVEPGGSKPDFFVAEELSVPQRLLSPEAVEQELAEKVGNERLRLSMPAAEIPPQLLRAAKALAEKALAAPAGSEIAVLDTDLRSAVEAAQWRGSVHASLQLVPDPEDFVLPAQASEPAPRAWAAGAAFRPDPRGGGSYVIVMLVAAD
ncbi:MAG: CAP domain-containing protein [Elusimicrobia bacterium]|nr:CAP domain-containing protein [Elusimicrobiota bacterium]